MMAMPATKRKRREGAKKREKKGAIFFKKQVGGIGEWSERKHTENERAQETGCEEAGHGSRGKWLKGLF